jgi:bacteriorhodopsin
VSQAPGLLSRILGIVIGAAVLVLAFVFSVVIFAIALVAAVVILAILWWKTRSLRRTQGDTIIETTQFHVVREETPERPAIEGESKREGSNPE